MHIPNPFDRKKAPETQEIVDFCANPDLINYTCMALRVGILGWMTQTEYTYFKPDTDANDNFFVAWMRWPKWDDMKMYWVIVSMPREYESKASALLWQNGLKCVKPDFIQIVIDEKGQHKFPIIGDNVRHLENHSKGAPNVMYTNDAAKTEAAHKHEKQVICQPYFDAHLAWLNTPEGRRAARAYWAKHPEMQGEEPPYTGEPFDEGQR